MSQDGQKMSTYTPLAAAEKDYFFGDGAGGVVAVGRVANGGPLVNRLVSLDDIGGGGGGGANYAKVTKTLTYDNAENTETLSADNTAYNVASTETHATAVELDINFESADFIDAYVEVKTNSASLQSDLVDIKVFNGATELTRLRPAGCAVLENVSDLHNDLSWMESFGAQDTLLIRVHGSTFVIYSMNPTLVGTSL